MAFHGFITITGKTQGLISAGCSTQESVGNKGLNEHVDEIISTREEINCVINLYRTSM